MPVRAKICGITRTVDAEAAVAAGVDALGFNFHRASPRYVDPDTARTIIERLPPFVTAVGLFVDHPVNLVREIAAVSGVTLLQFHGDESDDDCVAAGRMFIKAINANGPIDGTTLERQFPHASGFLLDSATPGIAGGSGLAFDWSWWPSNCARPLMLAGGLTPENVADAIARTRPYAVDVCSGVEGAAKGIKDLIKIERFMEEVRSAGRRS